MVTLQRDSRPLIHCIGDSHCVMYVGEFFAFQGYHSAGRSCSPLLDAVGTSPINYPFQVHWLGERTAYNMCRRKATIDAVLDRFWKPGDKVMFIAGEIDCRAHIVKQSVLTGSSIQDKAKESAGRLFWFAYDNYSSRGLVASFSVPTSMGGGGPREASRAFNDEMEALAKSKNVPFMSIEDQRLLYHDGTHYHPVTTFPILTEKARSLGII